VWPWHPGAHLFLRFANFSYSGVKREICLYGLPNRQHKYQPAAFEKRIKTNDNILQDLNSVNDVKWFFRPLDTIQSGELDRR